MKRVKPVRLVKDWVMQTQMMGPISGSPDMSHVRKNSNYSKWEVMSFENLRMEARDH